MPPGDLVAHGQLPLHGDEHLDGLDDAGGQLVPLLQIVDLFLEDGPQGLDLPLDLLVEVLDLAVAVVVLVELELQDVVEVDLPQDLLGQLGALLQGQLAGFLGLLDDRALDAGPDLLPLLVLQDDDLVLEVALELGDLVFFDGLGPRTLLDPPPREDADVDDRALDAGGAVERSVLDVQGLLSEDGFEQLLLGRQLGLSLGGHFADENVARLHVGADADDAVLVQVAQDVLRNVGDVPGDVLGSELGVPGFDRLLHDVEGGEDVFLDQLFADDDGVLEVVSAPRHEGAEDVPPER